MKVEEEETVMMKKKKNDDDDEEHGETNNNNSRNVLGKIQHPLGTVQKLYFRWLYTTIAAVQHLPL